MLKRPRDKTADVVYSSPNLPACKTRKKRKTLQAASGNVLAAFVVRR